MQVVSKSRHWSSTMFSCQASCRTGALTQLRATCPMQRARTQYSASLEMAGHWMLCFRSFRNRTSESDLCLWAPPIVPRGRRQCSSPVFGFIAKAEEADPNDVMPFFEAWGIHLPWAKTEWVPRSNAVLIWNINWVPLFSPGVGSGPSKIVTWESSRINSSPASL